VMARGHWMSESELHLSLERMEASFGSPR
jgi:hypothetical protein